MAAPVRALTRSGAVVAAGDSFSAKEGVESSVLAACKAPDFEILDRLGGGANGDVFLVRCKAVGHPYPHKLYALKVVRGPAACVCRGQALRCARL